MALLVRSASLDDGGAIAGLLGELGYPSDIKAVRARLRRLLGSGTTKGETERVFVATREANGDVLGLLSLHLFVALHDDAPVALITALVVAERARGLGIGRQLVDRAAEVARGWGCTRLIVTTHVRRADAHAFYERIGFELTGRRYAKVV